jgi:hypothetical protein
MIMLGFIDQKRTFKFPRVPSPNTGTKRAVGLGTIGVMTNGIGLFNPGDGMSFNSLGVWNRNAYFFEKVSFDRCNGHVINFFKRSYYYKFVL